MIKIKTPGEIEIMKESGKIAVGALKLVVSKARPGITTLELDKIAEEYIKKMGGAPSFKTVRGYKYTICATVNEDVVHGLPSKYKIKSGDIVGIDLGVYYKGFHSDVAYTVSVGAEDATEKFLNIGKQALAAGISKARLGNHVGDISSAIQKIVEGAGYSVVRSLVGHGVGRQLHEDPSVPGFLWGRIESTPLLKEGMTLAIEIIYNQGAAEVVYKSDDGWTISTDDGSLSGLFEKTIAITKKGPIVLTEYGSI